MDASASLVLRVSTIAAAFGDPARTRMFLHGLAVGEPLEKLSVLSGAGDMTFVPKMPTRLRASRTCYDHLAGATGVALHDHFFGQGLLS